MSLLPYVSIEGDSNLERILALDSEKVKEISASEIEIDKIAHPMPELNSGGQPLTPSQIREVKEAGLSQIIYNHAALGLPAVQDAHQTEVRKKSEKIFKIIADFLEEKGLKGSLMDTESADPKDNSKKLADELVEKIIKQGANWYAHEDPKVIKLTEETLDFRKDLFKEMLRSEMGIDWEQTANEFAEFGSLNQNNQRLQRIIDHVANASSRYYLLKRALAKEIGEDQEFNPLLEKEVMGYIRASGYELIPQSYNNAQLFNLLETVVGHQAYDLASDFRVSVEKLDSKTSIDEFIKGINIEETSQLLILDDIADFSKEELVETYAKLSHYEVSKAVSKETIKATEHYRSIVTEFLGDKHTVDDEEQAEELVDKLLEGYIRKRWSMTDGDDKIDGTLEYYKFKKGFADRLIEKDILDRRYDKKLLVEQLLRSNNLSDDQNLDQLLEALARASVKGHITRKNIEEELTKRAVGRRESKDAKVVEAGQKYAAAMGYKIKSDTDIQTVRGIIGRTMSQKTYNLGDRFSGLYKKSLDINP